MRVEANWVETARWLEAIAQSCRSRGVDFLAVPLPLELALLGRRNESVYPAKITAIFPGSGMNYLDPIEAFAAEDLSLRALASREGRGDPYSLLYYRQYDDHHLSPRGCDLWAQVVARRLIQLWTLPDREWRPGPSIR